MKRLPSREGYDLYATNYRKDHPHLDSFMDGAESDSWFRALEALGERPITALDAGCGDGRTLGRWMRALQKRGLIERVTIHGADISPKMIAAARGRVAGPQWHVLDLSSKTEVAAWTKTYGQVDLVSAFFVIVHFERPKEFFAAAATLTAPGGRLVMNTLPQPSAPELRAGGKPLVIEAWDHRAEDVITAGEAAGFTLDHREDFFDKGRENTGQLVSTLLEWKRE